MCLGLRSTNATTVHLHSLVYYDIEQTLANCRIPRVGLHAMYNQSMNNLILQQVIANCRIFLFEPDTACTPKKIALNLYLVHVKYVRLSRAFSQHASNFE